MTFNQSRYQKMQYKRCGNSGLKLPRVSLGLWHNFGDFDDFENAKAMLVTAFDHGITHFDLANNYGPPPGSAEKTFGKILKTIFKGYRDELIISTKAGYDMWQGPYGDGGSRKYLMASLDQSLSRMGLDYVDIFYHHRPDSETPIEESMVALSDIVKQGKALYVGLSRYSEQDLSVALPILSALKTPCLIHQVKYSMIDRHVEQNDLVKTEQEGLGCITFSPLAKGLLTNRYLNGIPSDSRAANTHSIFLSASDITKSKQEALNALNVIAKKRDQSLAQMALAWVLQKDVVTSVLIGASKSSQIVDCCKALNRLDFSKENLYDIDNICKCLQSV
jgi:L-glyceraldehyde 3-phosphate reductase